MHYYKHYEDDKLVSYESSENENLSEGYVEISSDEFNEAISALSNTGNDNESSEISKDEYISQLEEENAALLYQVLTGEDYSSV